MYVDVNFRTDNNRTCKCANHKIQAALFNDPTYPYLVQLHRVLREKWFKFSEFVSSPRSKVFLTQIRHEYIFAQWAYSLYADVESNIVLWLRVSATRASLSLSLRINVRVDRRRRSDKVARCRRDACLRRDVTLSQQAQICWARFAPFTRKLSYRRFSCSTK